MLKLQVCRYARLLQEFCGQGSQVASKAPVSGFNIVSRQQH